MRPFCRKVAMSSSLKPRMCNLLVRGFQRGLRGAQIVLRLDQRRLALLVVLQRNGLAFEQILGAGVLDLRQIDRGLRLVQAGHGRDVIVLRLHRIGGLDHEQRLAFDDAVARPDQKLGDPAGIGREHRRGAILIDRDLALGDIFGAEGPLGDRLKRQAGPFGRRRGVALQSLAGLARHLGMSGLCRRRNAQIRKRRRQPAPAGPRPPPVASG